MQKMVKLKAKVNQYFDKSFFYNFTVTMKVPPLKVVLISVIVAIVTIISTSIGN